MVKIVTSTSLTTTEWTSKLKTNETVDCLVCQDCSSERKNLVTISRNSYPKTSQFVRQLFPVTIPLTTKMTSWLRSLVRHVECFNNFRAMMKWFNFQLIPTFRSKDRKAVNYDFDWTLCFKERMNCQMDQKSSFQETISIPGIEDTYLLMQILLWTTNKMLPIISLISPLNLVRKKSKSVLACLQLFHDYKLTWDCRTYLALLHSV